MDKKLIYLLSVSLAFGSSDIKLASNHFTPIDTLITLSKDSDEEVRMVVAANPNTPPEVLMELCNDDEDDVITNAVGNKNTPISSIIPLVKHQDDDIRSAVAIHPNLPKETMEILSTDKDEDVRESLASNTNAGDKILTLLSIDKDDDVVRAVAQNPSTPSSVIDKLSDANNSIAIRMIVAKNSNMTISTMEKILNSDEHDAMFIRAALARNPKATPFILSKLSTCDDFSFTRGATLVGVASNKNTPPEVLDKLGSHENAIVRAIVYQNPKTPASRLAILEKDDISKTINQNHTINRSELGVNIASDTRDTSILFGRPDIARNLSIINVQP